MNRWIEKLKTMEIPVNSPNLFLILIDSSGSMGNQVEGVKSGLNIMYEDMSKMDEASSVIIAKAQFNASLYLEEYGGIEDLNTKYNTGGNTALYESIYLAALTLLNGEDGAMEYLEDLGYSPKVTFIVLSDGGDNCGDNNDRLRAKEQVKMLNEAGATTAFVCFGGNISASVAEDLGFKNIDKKFDIIQTFKTISSSCVRQSQSSVSLNTSFFDNN